MVHLSSAHLSLWWWYPLWRTKEEMWKPAGQYIPPNPPVTQQDGEGPGFYSHLGQVKWLDSVNVESFSYTFNQCQRVKKNKQAFSQELSFHLYSFILILPYSIMFLLLEKRHSCSKFREMKLLSSGKKIRILVILISDLNLQVQLYSHWTKKSNNEILIRNKVYCHSELKQVKL